MSSTVNSCALSDGVGLAAALVTGMRVLRESIMTRRPAHQRLAAGACSLARARGDGKGHKHLAYLQRPIGVTASSSNSPKNGDFAARARALTSVTTNAKSRWFFPRLGRS